jgi:hemerythrin-like metal-binding protein
MALGIDWNDNLSVGDDVVDGEHRAFFAIVNHVHRALARGAAADDIELSLNLLTTLSRRHFAHERHLMERSGYPGTQAHVAEHAAWSARLAELCKLSVAGDRYVAVAAAWEMLEWLRHHILGADMDLQEWVHGGSRPRGTLSHALAQPPD